MNEDNEESDFDDNGSERVMKMKARKSRSLSEYEVLQLLH